VKAYRPFILSGALAAVAVWGANAPLLLELMRVGEISALVLLLFIAAVVALALGAWRVHRGRNGRISFALHIVFAGGGAALIGMFFPRLPLALSLVVAIAALVGSFTGEPAVTTVDGDAK
jgi:hypothetical protein